MRTKAYLVGLIALLALIGCNGQGGHAGDGSGSRDGGFKKSGKPTEVTPGVYEFPLGRNFDATKIKSIFAVIDTGKLDGTFSRQGANRCDYIDFYDQRNTSVIRTNRVREPEARQQPGQVFATKVKRNDDGERFEFNERSDDWDQARSVVANGTLWFRIRRFAGAAGYDVGNVDVVIELLPDE